MGTQHEAPWTPDNTERKRSKRQPNQHQVAAPVHVGAPVVVHFLGVQGEQLAANVHN